MDERPVIGVMKKPIVESSASSPSPLSVAIAWGGAVAFAAALGYFLYAYLVRFDAPARPANLLGGIATSGAIDVALFTGFAFHHSLFARTPWKDRVGRIVSPLLERSFYTWVASALFAAVCWWWVPIPGGLYRIDGPWQWLGWTVQAAGLLLTFFASRALDVLDLAGVRPLIDARTTHVPITTTGVFAIVRHPLYLGWTLLVFGAPHMNATRALFAVISTSYLALAIPWEERALVRTFGEEYKAYRKRTRWRMLPGVY